MGRKFWCGIGLACTLQFLLGCQLTYLAKNAYYQSKILLQRESVEKSLKNPDLNPETKRKLNLISEVREFADRVLGLNVAKNYLTYVNLDREYVTWIVQATPEYEIQAYLWWFPIVGSVPYKGFFTLDGAEEEAKRFNEKEFDVHVRGVTAYSTLGWFSDPILSTMMTYNDEDLVNLIIHESVHTSVFFKSFAEFNEQLATFLGDKGTELFYLNRDNQNWQAQHRTGQAQDKQSHSGQKIQESQTDVLARIAKDKEHATRFSTFITREIRDLKEYYQKNKASMNPAMKAAALSAIQERYQREFKLTQEQAKKSLFLQSPLNNAVLLSYQTYVYDLSSFAAAFDKLNLSYRDFVKQIKTLENVKDPLKEIKQWGL